MQLLPTRSVVRPSSDAKNSTANEIKSKMLILELDIERDCSKYKIVFCSSGDSKTFFAYAEIKAQRHLSQPPSRIIAYFLSYFGREKSFFIKS